MSEENNAASAKKRRTAPWVIRAQRRFILVFCFLILFFTIASLLGKDRSFSAEENRNLAEKPAFSLSSCLDGSYFTALSTYHSDQFPGRDRFMSLRFHLKCLLGQKEFGQTILGSDQYLMAAPVIPDNQKVSSSCGSIVSFCKQYDQLSVYFMLVPGAASILSDKVPEGLPLRDQIADIRTVENYLSPHLNVVDAVTTLSRHKDEPIYYKTDHHWTTLGACYAFNALADSMGLNATKKYNVYTVTDSFSGTQASQSGGHITTDSIQVYEPLDIENVYAVYYPDTKTRSSSLFVSSALQEKDQYTVFTGGNHDLIQISTTNQNGRKLLILKDSYANCFLEFLTPYFEQIDIVDPRYYYENLGTLIRTDNITDVLFLYSANTFMVDTTLTDVLNTANE